MKPFEKIFIHNKEINVSLPIWDFELMFLKNLHQITLEILPEFRQNIYRSLIGNLNELILKFRQEGLIRDSTLFDYIEKEYSLLKLKSILRSNEYKISGNKSILVDRVLTILTSEEIEVINSKSKFLVLTDAGKKLITNDKVRFNKELQAFQFKIYDLILNRQILTATKLVSKFYATYPFPIGMGSDWSNGFLESDIERITRIIDSKYSKEILEYSNSDLEIINTLIATDYAFSFMSITEFDSCKFIIERYPYFSSNIIEQFLSKDATGCFDNFKANNKLHIAKVFRHSVLSEAINTLKLIEYKNCSFKERFKGISILSGNPKCKYCNSFKSINYCWGELDKMPCLPKYPGCNCCYNLF